jgi:hypothetical protein
MFTRQWTLAFTLCLAVGSWGQGQTPAPANPDNARIEVLVRKLGSSSFVQREQARKELEVIGTPALEPLRRANKTADAETNRRIAEMIRLFEEQLLTRQILAPKEVHLKLTGVAVQQAITELANVSGYPIQFQGDATKFADKKITLDSGKLAFWEALDRVCEQAGLMDRIDLAVQVTTDDPIVLRGKKGGIRRIQQFPLPAPAPPGPIVLVHRGNEKSIVSYAGAVKTELRISRKPGAKEMNLLFVVSAEPRLLNNTLLGQPIIDKAFDDQSRILQTVPDVPKADTNNVDELQQLAAQGLITTDFGMQVSSRRSTQIRVKDGEQTAKQLKELAGKLTLQLDLQNETLARIDKVLEAAGKSAGAANGGTMKVHSVKKLAGGVIEVQVSLENLAANPFGPNIIVNANGGIIIRGNVAINGGIVIGPNGMRINGGNGNRSDLPDLVDSKGKKFELGDVSADSFNFVNGSSSRTATILYVPHAGQTEPRELVLFGTRTHTIAVPFRFENLPLP